MINIKREGIVLNKTVENFENQAVLNPAVINIGNKIHMYYREVQKGNFSSIGYCSLNSFMTVKERLNKPLLSPQFEYEKHGIEDPRIVKIDGLYYMTYTAYDGVNALGALAISKDLMHFKKKGLIVPKIKYNTFIRLVAKCALDVKYYTMNENQDFLMIKDVVFFPRRIKGNLCFMVRIRPDIQIVSVKDLEGLATKFWTDYFLNFNKKIMLTPKHEHEMTYIGAGCPPIETKH